MKKIFLLLLVVFSTSLRAQWVSLPDTFFGDWLYTHGYDTCLQGNNNVGWQMDTTCPTILGAAWVNCSYSFLTDLTGIQYFHNLYYLDCSRNHLSSLPYLFDGMTNLDCHENQISSLANLPGNLISLDCAKNALSTLPPLPDSLISLSCYLNHLSVLPTLPHKLSQLGCQLNDLISLPALPDSLTQMSCSFNQLSLLPALPNGLTYLGCAGNQLDSLPPLPDSLTDLDCGGNQLRSLPVLPNGLTGLSCGGNQITSLPEFPDSLNYCYIDYNPIACLPLLKRIVDFGFVNTLINCKPNYGIVTNSTPSLDTIPLCDLFNANNCDVLWNISGKTFYDSDNNCVKDLGDTAQRNVKVELRIGGNTVQQTFTGSQGFYSFNTDQYDVFDLRIDTSMLPYYVSCPANNLLHDTITAIDSFHSGNNFALECKSGFDLTAWCVFGVRPRPADFTPVFIHAGDMTNFYGVHCALGVSGTVTVTINGSANYVSPLPGSLTPNNVAGNVITYNVSDFGATNFNSDFNFIVQVDTNAGLHSQLCFTVLVSPTTGDYTPSNNLLNQCFEIVAAFDPNNKEVYPKGDIDTTQKWLTYTINFQNTGTDTARHIYLIDTLDTDLDYSSFQLLAYSHQPLVQIKENVMRLNFPNIYLPDSNINEPASHGFVQYKIKIKDNLTPGTQINNTAYIYFDFNAPVVTNTTNNTITAITTVSNLGLTTFDFRLFPNPTNNMLGVTVDERAPGSTLTIYDVTGKKMTTVNLTAKYSLINTQLFPDGVYIAEIATKDASARKRWVKM